MILTEYKDINEILGMLLRFFINMFIMCNVFKNHSKLSRHVSNNQNVGHHFYASPTIFQNIQQLQNNTMQCNVFQNGIYKNTKSCLKIFVCRQWRRAIDLFTDSDAIFEMSIRQCIMGYSWYMKSKQTSRYNCSVVYTTKQHSYSRSIVS